MGVVYRVTNVALNRIYALKVLAPELAGDDAFRARFKREMRIAASINHPNVVAIHYAGEQDGLLFFVMDFVHGKDLRDILKTSGALDLTRAVELLTQLAAALDAAHARGLVHRDVKPANILITVRDGEEHVYLTDFGVAKRFDTVAGLTAQGAVVGTVDYMAPEQITGGETDARTDIYALGCVFFQMMTGTIPYERENSVAKLFAHVHEPPPAAEGELASLYPTFGAVLAKAMAKAPEDRYVSTGDFARDAAAALKGMRYTGATIVATGEARPSSIISQPGFDPPPPIPEPEPEPEPELVAAAAPEPAPAKSAASAEPPTAPPPPIPLPSAADRPRRGSRALRLALTALVAIGTAIGVVLVLSSGGGSSSRSADRFTASAEPVPTNRVTGHGSATVQLHGKIATVTVQTVGLLNGSPHAMHIHAGGKGICPTTAAAHLHNGHLAISTTDGIRFYGPPEVALTSHGDTSPKSTVDFSRYPSVGSIHYTRADIVLPPGVADAIPLRQRRDRRPRYRLQRQRHLRQRPGPQRAEQCPARRGHGAGSVRVVVPADNHGRRRNIGGDVHRIAQRLRGPNVNHAVPVLTRLHPRWSDHCGRPGPPDRRRRKLGLPSLQLTAPTPSHSSDSVTCSIGSH
jgi:serine/threonine protein kinase